MAWRASIVRGMLRLVAGAATPRANFSRDRSRPQGRTCLPLDLNERFLGVQCAYLLKAKPTAEQRAQKMINDLEAVGLNYAGDVAELAARLRPEPEQHGFTWRPWPKNRLHREAGCHQEIAISPTTQSSSRPVISQRYAAAAVFFICSRRLRTYSNLYGAKTLSRRQGVLVNHTTETIATVNTKFARGRRDRCASGLR